MGKTAFAQPAIFEENKRFTAVGPTGATAVSHPTPYLRDNALVFGDCVFKPTITNLYNTSDNYGL
ncbi:MAG: hypothetical protein IKU56_01415, partial [Clostridia bacterium]|nr:hypothetical protein [Clostridia bacterium]